MPLFFLPFSKVTEWAGLPKGIAAMYQWLASELKLDGMLKIVEPCSVRTPRARQRIDTTDIIDTTDMRDILTLSGAYVAREDSPT